MQANLVPNPLPDGDAVAVIRIVPPPRKPLDFSNFKQSTLCFKPLKQLTPEEQEELKRKQEGSQGGEG